MAFKDFAVSAGKFLWNACLEKLAEEEQQYEADLSRYDNMDDEQFKKEFQRHKVDIARSVGRTKAYREAVAKRKEARENENAYRVTFKEIKYPDYDDE